MEENKNQQPKERSIYQQSLLNFVLHVPAQTFSNQLIMEDIPNDMAFVDHNQKMISFKENGFSSLDGAFDFVAYRKISEEIKPNVQNIPKSYLNILNERNKLSVEEYTKDELNKLDLHRMNILGEKFKTMHLEAKSQEMQAVLEDWVDLTPQETPLSAFAISFRFVRVSQEAGLDQFHVNPFKYQLIQANGEVIDVSEEEAKKVEGRLADINAKVKQGVEPDDKDYEMVHKIRSDAFDQALTAKEAVNNVAALFREDEVLRDYRPFIGIANNVLCVPSHKDPYALNDTSVLDRFEERAPCIVPYGDYKKAIEEALKEEAKALSASEREAYFKDKLSDLQNTIFNSPDKTWATGIGGRTAERVLENGTVQTVEVSQHMVDVLYEIKKAQQGSQSYAEAAEQINDIAIASFENRPKNRTEDTHALYRDIKDTLFFGYEMEAKEKLSALQKTIFSHDWGAVKGGEAVTLQKKDGSVQTITVPKPVVAILEEISKVAKGEKTCFKASKAISKILNHESQPKKGPQLMGASQPHLEFFKQVHGKILPNFEQDAKQKIEDLQKEIMNRDWSSINDPKETIRFRKKDHTLDSKEVLHPIKLMMDQMQAAASGKQLYSEALYEIKSIANTYAAHKKRPHSRDSFMAYHFYQDIAQGRIEPKDRVSATLTEMKLDYPKPDSLIGKFLNNDTKKIEIGELNDQLKNMGIDNVKTLLSDPKKFDARVEAFALLNTIDQLNMMTVGNVLDSDDPIKYAKSITQNENPLKLQ